jgi:acetoin utilization protein AcuB
MTIDHDLPIESLMTRTAHTISWVDTLDVAEKLMEEHEIRHLPVLDDGKLVGALSDREMKLAIAMSAFQPERIRVADACSHVAYAVHPSTPISTVAHTMADKRYGSAIVVDDDHQVLGIFTTTDACRALAAALER